MVDLRIILHGGKEENSGFDEALARARERHPEAEIIVDSTFEAGDAQRLAREACRLGGGRIAAAGGDGTLHQIMGSIVDNADCSLAIIPMGTANDFATAAGIPLEIDEALDLAIRGKAHRIDAGTMADKPFLNVATGGFGPKVTSETPEPLKRSLGGFAYMVAAFTQMKEHRTSYVRVKGDDFEWEGESHGFAIGNGRLAGGNHEVCPDALVDDGLLDVAVLPGLEEGRWIEALRLSMNFGWQALESEVLRWKTTSVSVELEREACINLDGEANEGRHLEFRVLKKCIDVVLPEDSPLLAKEES